MTLNIWALSIIGGLYLLLLGVLAILLVINADQRAALAAADSAATFLQVQNREWAAKTTASNAALAAIEAADAANTKAIAKAQAAASKAGHGLKDEAARIGELKLTGSDCAQVRALRDAWVKLHP